MATREAAAPHGRTSPFFEAAAPATHALLRLGAGLLFMQHGVQKLFGWLGGMGGSGGSASLLSLMGVAGVLETFGGLLLLVGLFTRPVAFLLAGQMVVAYVMAHMPQGGLPIQNQGEPALLFALVFLFLFGNGAGVLSVDQWRAQRRRERRGMHDRFAEQRDGREVVAARRRGAA